MEARTGARQFLRFKGLARGGTIARSVAFRNFPGPSVPPKEAGLTAREAADAPLFVQASARSGLDGQ